MKEGYRYISLDITNENEVENVLMSENPDVIINTVAMTNVDYCEEQKEKCYDLNVNAVKTLSEISTKINRILFIFLLILFLMEKMDHIQRMIFQILCRIMDCLN